MMQTVLVVIAIYLLMGTIALGILDLTTKRIRTQLRGASFDSQTKLANAGAAVGSKTALIFTIIALWIFWPVAIIGAIGRIVNDKNKEG